jgi:hypothetical protein
MGWQWMQGYQCCDWSFIYRERQLPNQIQAICGEEINSLAGGWQFNAGSNLNMVTHSKGP